ncbi:MAG: hypothetical protein HC802_04640 [Caldilineaceae bacterium]|nr:hypothetical protein [Caldilineaceae bacterium]
MLPSAEVSKGYQQRITRLIQSAADGIPALNDPHAIQIRQVEGKLFITIEARVDGGLSIVQAHDLSTQLQEAVRAIVPNTSEVLVHLEPEEADLPTTADADRHTPKPR